MGEVTAAVVAGALSPADGLKVISTRSRLMKRLSGQGAMALLELDADATTSLIADYPDVTLAVFAAPGLGGSGYPVTGGMAAQFGVQAFSLGVVIVWTAVVSLAILFVTKLLVGLRASDLDIEDGLDLATHGERATPT